MFPIGGKLRSVSFGLLCKGLRKKGRKVELPQISPEWGQTLKV